MRNASLSVHTDGPMRVVSQLKTIDASTAFLLNTIIKYDNIVKKYNIKWLNHIKTTLMIVD